MGYIIPPAGSGSTALPIWISLETPWSKISRRYPNPIPGPQQLAPFEVKEQRLFSELPPDVWEPLKLNLATDWGISYWLHGSTQRSRPKMMAVNKIYWWIVSFASSFALFSPKIPQGKSCVATTFRGSNCIVPSQCEIQQQHQLDDNHHPGLSIHKSCPWPPSDTEKACQPKLPNYIPSLGQQFPSLSDHNLGQAPLTIPEQSVGLPELFRASQLHFSMASPNLSQRFFFFYFTSTVAPLASWYPFSASVDPLANQTWSLAVSFTTSVHRHSDMASMTTTSDLVTTALSLAYLMSVMDNHDAHAHQDLIKLLLLLLSYDWAENLVIVHHDYIESL